LIGERGNPITGSAGLCFARGAHDRPRRRAAESDDKLAPVHIDHLVGALLENPRHVEIERLGGFEC